MASGGTLIALAIGRCRSALIQSNGHVTNGVLGGGVGDAGIGQGSGPLECSQPCTATMLANRPCVTGSSADADAGPTTVVASCERTSPSNVITSPPAKASANGWVLTSGGGGVPSDCATSGDGHTGRPGTPWISPTTVGQPSARRHWGPAWLTAFVVSSTTSAITVRCCPSVLAAMSWPRSSSSVRTWMSAVG